MKRYKYQALLTLFPPDRGAWLNGDDASEYFGPGEHFVLWFGTGVGYGVAPRRTFI